ncbi:MAG: hypothetical protein UY01_C0002G0020 [Candidatus Nomurabacteria bacterium GW2011_GWB1_47_6]|uniref:Glutamine-scyllo-inositol transaminase n=1 Tax=Candidatus Nomurabacteria bacterium GW2011_GWB1_47_6 TaxID=1618749 RepID=A0A0G1T2A9_9BACT|nr:MAG: hypothetical protein UY01_C0002G0020 [Candidatus Nomurabacteria bacterium GW2011_GWB1_47_6]
MISVSRPSINKKEIALVAKVLKSGKITQGPLVAEFEKKFARKFGARYAVALNSGTAALHAALHAIGVRAGDEVITTPFTFVATANAILMCGAKPVFVDISEDDFNLDPKLIEKKITPKTKAILPVDLYGLPYDADAISKIAKKNKIKIIEDACQAHGAKFSNKYAGTLGDIGAFSFYATKNMTTGEGGMILTNVKKYAEQTRQFRHHGQVMGKPYEYLGIGFNYRMNDLAAALGLEQLKKLDFFNRKRIENAEFFSEQLKNIPGLKLPKVEKNKKHVFHQYTVRITKEFKILRNQLKIYLEKKGIASAIYYPMPLHLSPHLAKLGYKKGDFPVAERLSKEVLSLPVHPLLTKKDLKQIMSVIKQA